MEVCDGTTRNSTNVKGCGVIVTFTLFVLSKDC